MVAVLVPVINQPSVDELVPEVEAVIRELVSLAVVVDSLVALGFAVELLELAVACAVADQ